MYAPYVESDERRFERQQVLAMRARRTRAIVSQRQFVALRSEYLGTKSYFLDPFTRNLFSVDNAVENPNPVFVVVPHTERENLLQWNRELIRNLYHPAQAQQAEQAEQQHDVRSVRMYVNGN